VYLSVQDQAFLDTAAEATTVVGDIDAWGAAYLDTGVSEDDYRTWKAWQERLLEVRFGDTPQALDASEE